MVYGDSKWADGNMFASLAYDYEVFGVSTMRASAYGQIGNFKLGGMLQNADSALDDTNGQGFMVNAGYIIDAVELKAQFALANDDVTSIGDSMKKGNSASIGLDYKLGASTTPYVSFTRNDYDNADDDRQYFNIGISHKF